MNWFTHLFGRLYFHRRIFYGLVVLGGLAYWLLEGKDQYSSWVAQRNELAKANREANRTERKLPDLTPRIIPKLNPTNNSATDDAALIDPSADQTTSNEPLIYLTRPLEKNFRIVEN